MTVKIKSAGWSLLCVCAAALTSCTNSRPPQTGFYCVDIPEGKSADAGRFVQTIAERLNFKVSEARFPAEKGPPSYVWNVYGRGVSLFVGTAMKDGRTDRFGNTETTFNPNRLDLHVAKTGMWQRVRFDEVLGAAKGTARQLGWSFTKAATGQSCAT